MRSIAILLAIMVIVVHGQFIKIADYADITCNSSTIYTVYRAGKCQTLSAGGLSSSTINQCTSSAVESTTYVGTCDGRSFGKASNPLSKCITSDQDVTSTFITCPNDFPYTSSNATDQLVVTFGGAGCTGPVYNIRVSAGINKNTTICQNSNSCANNNDGTSRTLICGDSAKLPGYVSSLQTNGGPIHMYGIYIILAAIFSVLFN